MPSRRTSKSWVPWSSGEVYRAAATSSIDFGHAARPSRGRGSVPGQLEPRRSRARKRGATMTVKVRLADASDVPAMAALNDDVQRLHVAARPDHFVPISSTAIAQAMQRALGDSNLKFWVAEVGRSGRWIRGRSHPFERGGGRPSRRASGGRSIRSAWTRSFVSAVSPGRSWTRSHGRPARQE